MRQTEWLQETRMRRLEQAWDLIVTMDEATGEQYSMFFVEQQGTASSFLGLLATMGNRGLLCSPVLDASPIPRFSAGMCGLFSPRGRGSR